MQLDKTKLVAVGGAVLALLWQVLNLYTAGNLDMDHLLEMLYVGVPALVAGGVAIKSGGMRKAA